MKRKTRLMPYLAFAVARVKKYIDEHPLDPKSTDELAEYAGVSRNLLQRAFKEVYKIHIKEYGIKVRMASAKQMLLNGMTVRKVAKICRYHSHSAFTTAFKNKFGMPPMSWVHQNK